MIRKFKNLVNRKYDGEYKIDRRQTQVYRADIWKKLGRKQSRDKEEDRNENKML